MKQMPLHIQKQLLYAAESRQYHLLKEIVNHYSETDVRDYYGNTPLMLAARNGNTRIVKTLLAAGACMSTINFNEEDALILASREAHPHIVRILLEHAAQFHPKKACNRMALVKTKFEKNSVLQSEYSYSYSEGDLGWEIFSSIKETSELRVKRTKRLLCKVVELLIEGGADINVHDEYNGTPLHYFIISKLDDCVQLLMKHSPYLNTVDDAGNTLLTYAVLIGNEHLAIQLLVSGADPTLDKELLHRLVDYGSTKFLKQIIDFGADVNVQARNGLTALHWACDIRGYKHERTNILLKAGADPTIRDNGGFLALEHAIMAYIDRRNFRPNLSSDGDSPDALLPFNPDHVNFILAAKGENKSLKEELANEVPDTIKTLALHEAIKAGRYDECRLLLEHGVNPNGLGLCDYCTPVVSAAKTLDIKIINLLISYGANFKLGNCFNSTPLHTICQLDKPHFPIDSLRQKRLEIAKTLLELGADVDAVTSEGDTALSAAVGTGADDIELIRLLLQHGASVNHKNENGKTPLQYAERHSSSEILALLREYLVEQIYRHVDEPNADTVIVTTEMKSKADKFFKEVFTYFKIDYLVVTIDYSILAYLSNKLSWFNFLAKTDSFEITKDALIHTKEGDGKGTLLMRKKSEEGIIIDGFGVSSNINKKFSELFKNFASIDKKSKIDLIDKYSVPF